MLLCCITKIRLKNISNIMISNASNLFANMSESDIEDYIASVDADSYISDSSYVNGWFIQQKIIKFTIYFAYIVSIYDLWLYDKQIFWKAWNRILKCIKT